MTLKASFTSRVSNCLVIIARLFLVIMFVLSTCSAIFVIYQYFRRVKSQDIVKDTSYLVFGILSTLMVGFFAVVGCTAKTLRVLEFAKFLCRFLFLVACLLVVLCVFLEMKGLFLDEWWFPSAIWIFVLSLVSHPVISARIRKVREKLMKEVEKPGTLSFRGRRRHRGGSRAGRWR